MAKGIKRVSQDRVVEVIGAAGGMGVTVKELVVKLDGALTESGVWSHLNRLAKTGKIQRLGKGRGVRFYIPGKSVKLDLTSNKERQFVHIDDPVENPMRNAEKYPDPTAGKAIKAMSKYSGIAPGVLYKMTTSGGTFLTLRVYPDTVLGYRVEFVPQAKSTDTEVAWQRPGTMALVHTNRITSTGFRSLLMSSGEKCPADVFLEIFKKSPFGSCKAIEVPVEKVVEKEVVKEVPVEKIVEKKVIDDARVKELLAERAQLTLDVNVRTIALENICDRIGEDYSAIDSLEHIPDLVSESLRDEYNRGYAEGEKVQTVCQAPRQEDILLYELAKQRADIYEGICKTLLGRPPISSSN